MSTIDKDWFLQKLGESNKSVRGLARHLDIDASAASRMLSGERRMKMDEANSIAQFLGVHVKDVLKHAGVAIDLDGQPTRILLAAIIKDDCYMEMLKDPRPLPQHIIERAQSAIAGAGNGKIIAAQVRAKKLPMALLDDAVFLFKHTDKFDPSCVGALSIVRGTGGIGLCRVISARKTGEAVVMGEGGRPEEYDLMWGTPVIAIIP